MSKQFLVIFDIDEALLHFVSNKYAHLFDELPEEIQEQFDYVKDGGHIILLRPYLRELFNHYLENPNIKVALWTYSEQEYAYTIQETLIKALKLPEDFFLFAYGEEDMIIDEETGEEDDYPKNLQKVYEDFPDFNVFNTFIVDDTSSNIKHEISQQNCILIQAYAPFGIEKVREDTGESGIEYALRDEALREVEMISDKVYADIEGCSIEDIEEGFETEHVFNPNRVKRMGLTKYLKTYAKPPCKKYSSGSKKSKEQLLDEKEEREAVKMATKMAIIAETALRESKKASSMAKQKKAVCLEWSSKPIKLITIGEPKKSAKFVMIGGKYKKHKKKTRKKRKKKN